MAWRDNIKLCLIVACTLYPYSRAQGQVFYDSIQEQAIQEVMVRADFSSQARAVSTQKSMDGEALKVTQAMQLSDALKYMSGATVKDYGGVGGLKTVSVRGLGAQHTAVSYNGVMVTDNQTGQIDLGRFSTSQAKNLRMVSGPDGDLLQPASVVAQAAVISIEGMRPNIDECRPIIDGALLGGSFGTWSAMANGRFKMGAQNSVIMQTEWLSTAGDYPYLQNNGLMSATKLRENSDLKRVRAEAALFRPVGEGGDISLRLYWFNSAGGLPANILYRENAACERIWNRNGFAQSTYNQLVNERLTLRFHAKYSQTYTRYLNGQTNTTQGKTDNRYLEREGYISGTVLYRLAEPLTGAVSVDGRLSALDGSGANDAHPIRYTLNSSVALKYAVERMTVIGRINHVLTHEKTTLRRAAESFDHLSPVVGMNWRVWPAAGLSVRASMSSTYRLPTFNDLYFEQIGRRDLRPEQATVGSVGIVIERELGGAALELYADAYSSHVKDRIMAVPGKNTAVWMMKNIGRVTTHGIESGVEVIGRERRIRPSLMLSYTYQRSMDKTDSGSTTWNHQLPYTPRHTASAMTWVETPLLNVGLNFIYSGEYYSNGYNGPEYRMPSYYELGCSLWKRVNVKRATMEMKVESVNLTDCQYELVKNYPMPGRQLRFSVKIEL